MRIADGLLAKTPTYDDRTVIPPTVEWERGCGESFAVWAVSAGFFLEVGGVWDEVTWGPPAWVLIVGAGWGCTFGELRRAGERGPSGFDLPGGFVHAGSQVSMTGGVMGKRVIYYRRG